MVAIEDARFYEHGGVDFQGIGRALVKDILSQSAAQGASTITEQFVKNALAAQGSRTVFQKFREAALAYRLERHWSKDKILTEYLNTIYFGEGAYGIEAAARTYFGAAHPGCGTETEPCASVLEPWEAATAGRRSSPRPRPTTPSPSPKTRSRGATWCSKRCTSRATSPSSSTAKAVKQALPAPDDIEPPTLDSEAPYFTAWLRQQLVDRYGAAKTFFGGLESQDDARPAAAGSRRRSRSTPTSATSPATASVVVIDNQTAGVKAMVGGPDFEEKPFNLATLGHRQPGSSIKPFILLTALEQGISPDTVYESAPQDFTFGKKGSEVFEVTNYEDTYLGSASTSAARRPTPTTRSTPSSALEGLDGETVADRTRAIARRSTSSATRRPISTNPAMVLGGLEEGVTPLEWTYAYSTLANDGDRVSGTLAPVPGDSPVAYTEVTDQDGDADQGRRQRLHPQTGARRGRRRRSEEHPRHGGHQRHRRQRRHRRRRRSGARPGRPRTTATPGSAARTEEVTACVWVGYADSVTPMETEFYNGGPVDGRHLPGADLGQRDLGLGGDQGRTGRGNASEERRGRGRRRRLRSDEAETYVPPKPKRNRSKPKPAPEAEAAPEKRRSGARSRRPEAAPEPAAAPRIRRHRAAAITGSASARPAWAARRSGLPAAQKRQGRSTAFVIPIRGPVTTSGRSSPLGRAAAGTGRGRGRRRCRRGRCRAPRSACRGPSRGRRRGASPRRARIRSRPAVGSSARISTAAASPSGSATALSRLWMP